MSINFKYFGIDWDKVKGMSYWAFPGFNDGTLYFDFGRLHFYIGSFKIRRNK